MSIIKDLQYQINELQDKLFVIEKERGTIPKALSPFVSQTRAAARTFGRAWAPQALYGVHMAVCVDTRDPWKAGRILVYCPIIHNVRNAYYLSESNLTWAMPCSSFGSLDEVGAVFVPPEGSTVLIMFEAGNRNSLFYIGATWLPRRASVSSSEDDFTPFRETYRWSGSPGSRASDIKNQLPDHLLPPWNNESYYGNDLKPTSELDIVAAGTENINFGEMSESRSSYGGDNYSTQSWRSRDIPHIYGIKTPEKHFIMFDDGSYEREQKLLGKRLVLQSSKGSVLFFKDDNEQTAEEIFQHKYWDTYNDLIAPSGSSQWFSKTANGHAIELNHTGAQIQSFGGGRLIIDDKLKGDLAPNQNQWSVSFPPSGGSNLWRTMVRLESHTEHRITLSDHHEDGEFIRSEKDGIFINSACGHAVQLQDHTEGGKAGLKRQVLIQSTSGHKIEMKDYQCSISSPRVRSTGRYGGSGQRGYRDEGVYDSPNFKPDGKGFPEKVCFKLTSGFGMFLLFEDGSNQTSVSQQYAKLSNAPGKNGMENFFQMFQKTGDKLVFLRCAGERLTTIEKNYRRFTKLSEIMQTTVNQIHICLEGQMIDQVLIGNLYQYVKLGNHYINVEQGVQHTYALQNTIHMCQNSPHLIIGGINPKGGSTDAVSPVLLYGGDGPLPSRPAKWLYAN